MKNGEIKSMVMRERREDMLREDGGNRSCPVSVPRRHSPEAAWTLARVAGNTVRTGAQGVCCAEERKRSNLELKREARRTGA